ncbi:predicted protein [Lichtheimia corymbifera JMRC:FSU:9682]|uniref:GATA-type domain-containing protein n=1 Tax=Lichtheimia corymbifera JMRC:FSU:9682 TaxID=1263082 RepID=A0A068S6W0_9FUNG|nr:predicted protein [Lichtheimia corymbifera JMRC:FSU:9682]
MTPPLSHQEIIIPNECLMDSCYSDEYNWLFDEGFFPFQSTYESQDDYYEEETNSSPTEFTSAVQDYEVDQIVRCCSNCYATKTPVWRKSKSGHIVCNACGQYEDQHGHSRGAMQDDPGDNFE